MWITIILLVIVAFVVVTFGHNKEKAEKKQKVAKPPKNKSANNEPKEEAENLADKDKNILESFVNGLDEKSIRLLATDEKIANYMCEHLRNNGWDDIKIKLCTEYVVQYARKKVKSFDKE